ncbi:hypothetical protein N7495_003454 [Penicillium taxi]|uniref:uncharacterized protein n=1 Tax=Penicillium taxi TaxID=168475 RepID=UPI002544EC0D|nr:uncharacterized protein N7495_003454 [Penicillium taxi]KAJ5902926.1 hypothetical protein N7495_003454 [Penicillium taxi]
MARNPLKAPPSKHDYRKKVLSMVVQQSLPFKFVESPSFKDLMEFCKSYPNLIEDLSRSTIKRLSQSEAEEVQKQLIKRLPSTAKVSLSLDCWTSPFKQAFLAVTCYFIDKDWEYQEVLLGFEPLHGAHSGQHLASIVLKVLEQHELEQRVLTITTDNASNNSTLVFYLSRDIRGIVEGDLEDSDADSSEDEANHLRKTDTAQLQHLQKQMKETTDILAEKLPQVPIIRVPCIYHVIQLSLGELMKEMKATPKNDTLLSQWKKEDTEEALKKRVVGKISTTLYKIRALTQFINASPQRREAFLSLQSESSQTNRALVPIQDVRTRWNSTYQMLQRAKRLQKFLNRYCSECSDTDKKIKRQLTLLALCDDEWEQVEYLLEITEPFFDFTRHLSQTKKVTTHFVFPLYNQMFQHLETQIERLKRRPLKLGQKEILQSLHAAHKKLAEYYGQVKNETLGKIYSTATILAPDFGLKVFDGDSWEQEKEYLGETTDQSQNYKRIYRESLERQLVRYQSQNPANLLSQTEATSRKRKRTKKKDPFALTRDTSSPSEDELTRYLHFRTSDTTTKTLRFWKDNARQFPTLAQIARDYFAVPASGAGVERLFNTARDICHYRRGRLQAETIKDLMILRFTEQNSGKGIVLHELDYDSEEAEEDVEDGDITTDDES